ncbi:hypothetical protein [Rhodococcus sp. IEGM 1330]|uniref:hypothetical protein n=1 Tax=Rhodococcus sp. IEGM 1330 TaxID=3082225 RepID=UPI0029535F72|nr:hypothetical protein [Rhodococcus sp. IEGM 1330]MDV8022310.1 hypothetical protein [Rhodococcus sp. IEGM 1330]
MTAETADPKTVVVFDDRVLWHLASGTKIREIGAQGRTFIADSRTPGRVWHDTSLCTIGAIEMPVEVTRGQ